MKMISVVILVLNIVTGFAVTTLIVSRGEEGQTDILPGFCIPCDGLDPKFDEGKDMKFDRRRDINGQELCCGSTSTQLSTILNQMYHTKVQKYKKKDEKDEKDNQTKAKQDLVPPIEFLSLLKPIAHLTGITEVNHNTTESKTSTIVPVRNWKQDDATILRSVKNGMMLQNGSIIVPTSGLYRVYSSVKFYVETPRGNQNQPDSGEPFVHKIFRYDAANDKEVEILSNTHSKCETQNGRYKEYPSYISGIVYLNTADSLTVKVSYLSEILHNRNWHYFGAYLV